MSEPGSDVEERARGRIGTVLRGKYRLDRLLGIGGMAAVYKATHRNRAEFAIKLLHVELSIHESVRTRFVREGYAANSVKHPGAVLVVDDDVDEAGQAFLVMELLRGEELEELRSKAGGFLPPPVAVALVLQLLDVLGAAHAAGIVHRDIKPPNLFLTTAGTLKVLDFGIARARDIATESAGVTGTGILLGTPAYMAPEQAMAQPERIGGWTDLWAAGATLFTLLTGEYVHGSMPAMQAVISTATKPARPLLSVWTGGDPGIAAVVDRALAFGPEARWRSADEMRAALDVAGRAAFGSIPTRDALESWLEEQDPALVSTHREGGAEAGFESSPAMSEAGAIRVTPSNSDAAEVVRESFASGSTMLENLAPLVVPRSVGRSLAPAEPRADTTTRPVSSSEPHVPSPGDVKVETPASLPRARGGLRVVLIASTIGAVAATYYWLAPARTVGRAEGPPPAAATAPPPVVVVASSASVPLPLSAPPPGGVTSAEVSHVASSAPREMNRRPPIRVAPAVAHAPAPPTTTEARRAAAPPPGTPRSPDCDPDFVLDAEGHKHFKPECFH